MSGLVCGALLNFVEAQGGSSAAMASGLGVPPERLRQWHAWFPWDTYLALEERFGQAMAHLSEPYLELGRFVVTHRWLGAASLVLRAVATPERAYQVLPGMVPRFLLSGTSVKIDAIDAPETAGFFDPRGPCLAVTYRFPRHMLPTAATVEIIRGQLLSGPPLFGEPEPRVRVARHEDHLVRYELCLHGSGSRKGRGFPSRLGEGLMGARRRMAVILDLGGELLRTNALLGQKLRELEEANRRLHQEARERQRAAAAVRVSEERYRVLAEAADDAIAVLDTELRFLYANRASAALLGMSSEAMEGRSLRELLPEPNSLNVADCVRQVLRTGLPMRREGSAARDGHGVFLETSFVPLQEGRESGEAVLCIARDITARKQAERERALLNLRLQHTERLESMGVLVGGIAHDFNNLLTVVRGNAELARERLGQEHGVSGLLRPIVDAAQQGAELCRLMLAFAGKGVLPQRLVDLSDVLLSLESLLGASVPSGTELHMEIAESLPPVLGDATQLRQLALNLVMNGAEALGGAPGRVTLRAGVLGLEQETLADAVLEPAPDSPPCDIFLEVEDSGCGMDEETRARAFDPFFTTKFPGRGLGLSAVLGIVKRHGGGLAVRSTPGEGTRIRVCLAKASAEASPIRVCGAVGDAGPWAGLEEAPVEDAPPGAGFHLGPEMSTLPEGSQEQGSPLRPSLQGAVLLVDDEPEILEVGRAILEELGMEVLTASDGREALERFALRREAIAVAILDVTMPRMDGAELFRSLREMAPSLPILLMSGHGAQEVEARLGALNTYVFLPKPFSIQDLAGALALVHGALGDGPSQGLSHVTAGGPS